ECASADEGARDGGEVGAAGGRGKAGVTEHGHADAVDQGGVAEGADPDLALMGPAGEAVAVADDGVAVAAAAAADEAEVVRVVNPDVAPVARRVAQADIADLGEGVVV